MTDSCQWPKFVQLPNAISGAGLLAVREDFLPHKRENMLEVAGLSNTVIVSSIWKCTPNLAVGFADSEELSHVGWSGHKLHVSDMLGLSLYNNS